MVLALCLALMLTPRVDTPTTHAWFSPHALHSRSPLALTLPALTHMVLAPCLALTLTPHVDTPSTHTHGARLMPCTHAHASRSHSQHSHSMVASHALHSSSCIPRAALLTPHTSRSRPRPQVWGTSDVLAARLGLTLDECRRAMKSNENHTITPYPHLPDLLRAGWDSETGDWGAFAAAELNKNDVIGA